MDIASKYFYQNTVLNCQFPEMESTECRKAKGLSQKELADLFNTSHTTIGKYERDEMTPSIEAAKKLAKILNTTVGYLLGENAEAELSKDPAMLKRFQDISVLPEKEKECILTTVDHFIKASKLSMI
ncbi:MAG TPA: helix-turn-helix transcriptional regulator [Saprospiraceae bacterium]|nr:helix-turn-helix transcriptional regulator [Saprospiraceae bacterium]